MAKAEANEYGVEWATSKSGKLSIALKEEIPGRWRVWGLYTGTHDLAPIARDFKTEAEARKYANGVWRNR